MTSPGAVKHYPIQGDAEYFYGQDAPVTTVMRAAAWWIEQQTTRNVEHIAFFPELGGWSAQVTMQGGIEL